jgi:hypothetical protein
MGLIIREKEPHNLESPFAQIESLLPPNELLLNTVGEADCNLGIDGNSRVVLVAHVEGAQWEFGAIDRERRCNHETAV